MGESRSVVDAIKNQVRSGGSAFKNFFAIRGSGEQVRIRFLDNLDKAIQITMHTRWQDIDHPCLTYYGKPCPNCDNPDIKAVDFFAMNVYNYETKKVEIFFFKASKNSPLNQIVMIYENSSDDPKRKTITNQDLIIQRNGVKFETSYAVIQGRKGQFPKAGQVKKFTKKEIFDLVLKAHNKVGEEIDDYEDVDEYEDDEVTMEEKRPTKKSMKKPKSRDYDDYEEYDDDEEYEDDDDEYDDDYDDEVDEDDDEEYEDDDDDEYESDDDAPWDDDDDEEEEDEEYEPPKRRTKKAPAKKPATKKVPAKKAPAKRRRTR